MGLPALGGHSRPPPLSTPLPAPLTSACSQQIRAGADGGLAHAECVLLAQAGVCDTQGQADGPSVCSPAGHRQGPGPHLVEGMVCILSGPKRMLPLNTRTSS